MKINALRRQLLKASTTQGVLLAALAAGLLRPTGAWSQTWNQAAFDAATVPTALESLGATGAGPHPDLQLKVPIMSENGAVVPVEVVSEIPGTVSIAILVDRNPTMLSALFEFRDGGVPEVAMRLKIAEDSPIRAVATTADGKRYTVMREIQVATAGC